MYTLFSDTLILKLVTFYMSAKKKRIKKNGNKCIHCFTKAFQKFRMLRFRIGYCLLHSSLKCLILICQLRHFAVRLSLIMFTN